MTSRISIALMLGCLLLIAESAFSGQDKGKTDPPAAANYYPLEVGNEWHYKTTVKGNSASTTSTVAKIETIDNIPLARLEVTTGKRLVTEHLRQTGAGVFRYRNAGQEILPPICLLKYPIVSGNKWTGTIKVGKDTGKYQCEAKEEAVEVPAGKFKAMRVLMRIESNKQTTDISYWFVNDVGFVKQTVEQPKLKIVLELEKFVVKKSAGK